MTSVTSANYLDILNLVYNANRCEDLENLIRTVCPSMMQIFRSECATFHLVKGHPQQLNIIESRSFKSDYLNLVEDKYYPALYQDGYYQRSPLLKEAMSSSKTALKIGDSIPQRDWERSNLYNDFILPQHLYWELFLTLRWKNCLKGMITLWRPGNQPNFEKSDVIKSEILAPHLILAIRNINKISKINRLEKQPLSADDASNEGLILLDHKLRPVYSNVKAREICLYLFNRMPSDTLNIERGEFTIPSCIIKDCCDLLNLLKVEERLTLWPKERIIFLENGKQYRIEYSLTWKADQATTVPQFIVTLSDLASEKKLEAVLRARLHLSRREVDIVNCLMADMCHREIAEKLCISKLTVHTHVKNIYRKLGVKNKIELFRCVQRPSWLI
jgi:DNA-binding CsgD family transcriptional regulator